MGVDMATRRELIAAQKTIPQIREALGADSLGYLSLEGIIEAVGLPKDKLCLACFTGQYPLPVQLEMGKLALERTDAPSASAPDSQRQTMPLD
jgi:amidophosphoribosyltransferase